MKRISETVLLESVRSLRETMAVVSDAQYHPAGQPTLSTPDIIQDDVDHTDPALDIPYDLDESTSESVTFTQEDSLARIIQLTRG